ncbi:MAG: Hpt domain-containing protein, partial [Chromatiaceae bacterium]|nr:Hpt domain-containing protein [Chromatiaceae bacterium]
MTQTSGDAWPSAVDVDVDVDVDAGADDGFCIDVLVERLDGDEEIAREVAQAFVESTQELLQQLDDAMSVGRHETVRLNAHSIKGAAANIGADALAETAAV